MSKYTMNVTTNDQDNTQARIIIEVNGIELDILADDDGIVCTLQTAEGHILKEMSHDWEA